MKSRLSSLTVLLIFIFSAGIVYASEDTVQSDGLWGSLQKTVEKYLGKPYVWGAVGLKSFDCSGFVWRVMAENGILIKRTTARKLYMSLPRVAKDGRYNSGALVFFDNLKHVGIVKDRESFYHAQVSRGTNLSEFSPYWRRKVCGFRRLPIPQ
ncbi:MAG: NlpC/P60 family protein [Nitrospirota bacterium]